MKIQQNFSSKSLWQKEKFRMKHKHIAEEIHFDLKELFEICANVILESNEGEDVRGVLKVAKALIMNTSYSDGNHFSEEEKLYELADEYLSDFYDRNGIEELYEIDDAVNFLMGIDKAYQLDRIKEDG